MKKNNKKRKGPNQADIRCPYCGSHTIFRNAEGIYTQDGQNIMLYVCARYPECDAYVNVHAGTKLPMGTLANGKLRNLRHQAHKRFDRLHQEGYLTKDDAYCWLANLISAPKSQAHIGYLGEYYCNLVIEESKKYLDILATQRKNNKKEVKKHHGTDY